VSTVSTLRPAPTDLVGQVRAHLVAGAGVATVAARLGMPDSLVTTVVDALVAAGTVAGGCSPGCALPRQERPVTCAGCPLAR
jgi:phosphate/sulfate permease